MQGSGRGRAVVKWGCLGALALVVCLWVASRWVVLDWATGTRLDVSVDQGMLVLVYGDAVVDFGADATVHERDEVVWQWWFARFPESLLVPLWAPGAVLAGIAAALSLPRRLKSGRGDAARLIAAIGH